MKMFFRCNRFLAVVLFLALAFAAACENTDAGMGSGSGGDDKNWSLLLEGNVRSLAISSDGAMYAAQPGVGVKKSTDAGKSWSLKNSGLTSLNFADIGVDPAYPTDLFVGTADSGLYRSTNSGESWKLVLRKKITTFAFAPTGAAFTGVDNEGIYRSTEGEVWNAGEKTGDVRGFAFSQKDPFFVGASTVHFFYKSIDYGFFWTQSRHDRIPGTGILFGVGADPNDPKKIWCGHWNYGIIRTTDGGENWTEVNNGLPADHEVFTVMAIVKVGGMLYAGLNNGRGVYKSNDDGANWVPAGLVGKSIAQNGLVSKAGKLYACTDGGLFEMK